jgi:hypothetical protein
MANICSGYIRTFIFTPLAASLAFCMTHHVGSATSLSHPDKRSEYSTLKSTNLPLLKAETKKRA